ncbi:MAG: hypothetical protein K0S07_1630 [Chlamydiales bacterium]|jgi:hypothetical protein|nr:hypothetical protein [Chlamydiales bacterium]
MIAERSQSQKNAAAAKGNSPLKAPPVLMDVERIWDESPHSAFTDLVRFQGRFLCTFREADTHVSGNGRIRILASKDAVEWKSIACLEKKGLDLRDPKLSVMPDGRLMLLIAACQEDRPELRQTMVAFSKEGRRFGAFVKALTAPDWLWRVTWHRGVGYGLSYNYTGVDELDQDVSYLKLYQTEDGVRYIETARLPISGVPSEASLQFLRDGRMMCLVRREEGSAWMGESSYPYREWKWQDAREHLGGPNLLLSACDECWVGGRILRQEADRLLKATVVGLWHEGTLKSVVELPSGGDTSYPGMVLFDHTLFISYYSSHEGKSAIYLAKVFVP